MKNKIVRIAVILFSLILLVCPLLNYGVSAYDIPGEIDFTLYNPLNLPYEGISALWLTGQFDENVSFASSYSSFGSIGCVVVENGVLSHSYLGEFNLSTIISPMLDDGVYIFVCVLFSTDGYVFRPELNVGSYRTYTAVSALSETAVVQVVSDDYNINLNMDTINHDGNMYTIVLYDMGTYFNSGGGTPTECPTLLEQIQDYNGTWAEFQGMMSTNSTLYDDFLEQKRIAYNDGIDMGQQNIINSINSDNNFLDLMDTFLNYGMNNTRDVIEDQLDLVYQNGIDRGIEDGYNTGYDIGYSNGYNKAASDDLVGGFFGDLLNTPINILNSITIYQISDGGTPLDTSDDVNITVWGLLVVVVIISLFLILLKIFAGG